MRLPRLSVAFCAVGLIVCLLPMFSVIVAGMAADMAGCTLHEGFTNPCVIAGKDRGELLYGMFVMGWLFLVTMPFAAIFAIALLIMGVRWWRRGRGDAPPAS